MRVVYVAGPFRARPNALNQWRQWGNVLRAARAALEVWRMGAVALCPHLNTAFFQGALPEDRWLEGDLALLRRCDAVLMVPGWKRSEGATKEHACAHDHRIPVFYTLRDLRAWVRDRGL